MMKFSIRLLLGLLILLQASCKNHSTDPDCAIIGRADSMLAAGSKHEALDLLSKDSMRFANKPQAIAMRYQLIRYKAMDMCFIPLTSDSMMVQVERYYAQHGNTNEQTLSRYLLAGCYRDMNLYTDCQKWANEAEEKADTSYKAFDYLLLYKVCNLKAELYIFKTADQLALEAFKRAAYYAHKSHDLLRETEASFRVAYVYSKMKQYEKAKPLIKECIKKYKMCHVKDSKYISLCLIKLAEIEIEQNHAAQAGAYLNEVEKREGSRLFDNEYMLKKGLFSYYVHKSDWYSLIHDYPAALACSRKQQSLGGIFRGCSWDEMADWFAQMRQYDSAYIYLRKFVHYDDSATKSLRAAELQATQQHFEAKRADKRVKEAKLQSSTYLLIAQGLGIALLWGTYLSILYFLKRKKREVKLRNRYCVILSQLEALKGTKPYGQLANREAQQDVEDASTTSGTTTEEMRDQAQDEKNKDDLGMNKIEYDELIKILKKEASSIEIKDTRIKDIVCLRKYLRNCEECRDLHLKINKRERIKEEDLQKMESCLQTKAPALHAFLTKNYADQTLPDIQYWTCILILFNVKVVDIAEILHKSQPAISMSKKRANMSLFKTSSGVSLPINLLLVQIKKRKTQRFS